MNDFSKSIIRKLAVKGIKLVGLQNIPDMSKDLPFACGERGYVLDDNGSCKVRTYNEVLELAR